MKSDTLKQLPDNMMDGDKITIKSKGHTYLIKHFAEEDGSYGKFHIFKDGDPIELIDYGVRYKFHGYNFNKKAKAYDALKRFLDSL